LNIAIEMVDLSIKQWFSIVFGTVYQRVFCILFGMMLSTD
jgi:hypothetical protein